MNVKTIISFLTKKKNSANLGENLWNKNVCHTLPCNIELIVHLEVKFIVSNELAINVHFQSPKNYKYDEVGHTRRLFSSLGR